MCHSELVEESRCYSSPYRALWDEIPPLADSVGMTKESFATIYNAVNAYI